MNNASLRCFVQPAKSSAPLSVCFNFVTLSCLSVLRDIRDIGVLGLLDPPGPLGPLGPPGPFPGLSSGLPPGFPLGGFFSSSNCVSGM